MQAVTTSWNISGNRLFWENDAIMSKAAPVLFLLPCVHSTDPFRSEEDLLTKQASSLAVVNNSWGILIQFDMI